MKSSTLWLASMAACCCISTVVAADAPKPMLIRDYTDFVAPADQQAYEAGIKSYNQCLSQHGFKYTWTAWSHETGDTFAYSYTTDAVPWSAFDTMHETSKACDAIFRSSVNPHLKSEMSGFVEARNDLSHMAKGMGLTAPYIEVIYFKLKNGHEPHETFIDVAKKIAAAADKAKWPNNYMIGEMQQAGADAPDFVVVIPAKSWEDLGKDPETPLWTMVENVYGKQDAQAMRKSLNEATESSSSHVDSYNTELTYKGASK